MVAVSDDRSSPACADCGLPRYADPPDAKRPVASRRMARIAVDTGALQGSGATLADAATDLGGARRGFARVASSSSSAGVPALAGAIEAFAGAWSASATALQLGAEHLSAGVTKAAGVYAQTDQNAMPSAIPTAGASPSGGGSPAPSSPPSPSPGPAPSPTPGGGG